MNKIVSNPKASETIKSFDENVRITRTNGNGVSLEAPGKFRATGTFAVVPGKQAITISVGEYHLVGAGKIATIKSFPKIITVFSNLNGPLAYALDRSLVVMAPFGAVNVNIGAGGHVLPH